MVLAPSVAGLFKWRQFEPEISYWQWAGTCVFHCRTVTSRNSLLSVDFWSTTSQSGGGSNVTRRKFSANCDRGSDRPTTVGGWTDLHPGKGQVGVFCFRAVDSSGATIDFLSAKRDTAAAERFLAKALGGEPSGGALIDPTSTPRIRPRLRSSKAKAI